MVFSKRLLTLTSLLLEVKRALHLLVKIKILPCTGRCALRTDECVPRHVRVDQGSTEMLQLMLCNIFI